ncbi:MAG: HD-GYP domain-containing protein, partial [Emergencia sp.]
ITNIQYMEEMKNQMWSFTEAMAEAIDARTPYNANHVRNVAMYAGKLADYINAMHDAGQEEEYFSQERKEQLVMSALLHDLGKMAVPTKIMNKATRLEEKLDAIGHRFETFRLRYRIQLLEGRITSEEYERKTGELDRIWQLVNEINSAGFLDDEREERIRVSFDRKFIEEGRTEPFFTEEEKEALLIKKGTLTAGERTVMESHVDMTERILNKVHFSSRDKDVAKWALQHHECLNGKGYPKRLAGDELCLESRILAVADICDALLASDRPYKKPMPQEKAFAIMEDMARSGSIDGKLVEYLEQCIRKDEAGGEVD